MSKDFCPKARKNEIFSTDVGKEMVVFNAETNTVSCLNELTTIVWVACDGKTNASTLLARVIRTGYSDATDHTIWMSIDQLGRAGLLEESIDIPLLNRGGMRRRELLRILGAGPVSTISIQPAMAQASCLGFNQPCSSNSQCCSNNCNPSNKCKK